MDVASPFVWTNRRAEAAQLLADDELPDHEIAAKVGVIRRTLAIWKLHPEFAARIKEIRDDYAAAIRARGIAERQNRVDAANDRHRRMQQVIDERAADPAMADIPGGRTGLLVAEPVLVKAYRSAVDPEGQEILIPTKESELVLKYGVDTGLSAEMRALEKQVAQDLGQWTEKQEHSGEIIVRRYEGVDVDEV
jgi:hypothetical protein